MQSQQDKEIISIILGKKTIRITPIIAKGEVNRVYFVKLHTNSVIVRLNDKEELGRFRKETWCMREAEKQGIPSPTVINIGEMNGTSYMVLNFIDGLNGEEITENKEHIWSTLGSYAKKIHSTPFSGFGEQMISPGVFNDSWVRFATYNIESLTSKDPLLDLNVINEARSTSLKRVFSNLLNKNFQIGLTHGDLSLANIIVGKDRINLIDWGSAEINIIPHIEILGILEDSLTETDPLFDSFLDGYGIKRSEFEELKPDLFEIALLIAVDKLRWAIDRKPEMINEFSSKVRRLISQS